MCLLEYADIIGQPLKVANGTAGLDEIFIGEPEAGWNGLAFPLHPEQWLSAHHGLARRTHSQRTHKPHARGRPGCPRLRVVWRDGQPL